MFAQVFYDNLDDVFLVCTDLRSKVQRLFYGLIITGLQMKEVSVNGYVALMKSSNNIDDGIILG